MQGLFEQLLGLVGVAETDGPARYAVVQCAEAGVGRTLQGFRVQVQGSFQIDLGVLDLAQRPEPALGSGPTAGDDAGPDPRLGHRLALPGKGRRLGGEFFEGGGALLGGQFVLDMRPALLDAGETLLVGSVQGPDALAQGPQQQAKGQFFHGFICSFSGF
ncbi:hypothetical protein D3C84_687310 [compost metagenome]